MRSRISALGLWVVPGALVALAGLAVLGNTAPVKPTAIRVVATPERVARGKYIYTLADCDGCHSARDWTRFAAPVLEAQKGQGVHFKRLGVASANITTDMQTGLGSWTDGLKIRAIRDGIGRDGETLSGMMPSERFRHMSDEDVYSLVAYLNSLPAVRHAVPRSKPILPGWFSTRRVAVDRVTEPNRKNQLEYGQYLSTLAGCAGCHTANRNSPAGSVEYGGGRFFHLPGGTVVSPNITPDPHTGIGRWTEEDWLARVYENREYLEHGSPKVGPENLTVMPWLQLCQLEAGDLKAIFAYLRTQKPVYRAFSRPATQ